MAGLPRSGSTVLSALLNQHPKIYSSPQTDLIGMLYELNEIIPTYESYKAGLLLDGYSNTISGIPDSFYSGIEKPVVIDKNRGWGTPYNFTNLSPLLNPSGKIIIPLRPILEIIASFIKVAQATEKTTGATPFFRENMWVSSYRTQADAQADVLMELNGEIDRAIFSTANLIKNHGDRALVVWYDHLLEAPQKTLDGIYDFLELERIENDFTQINEVDSHDDQNGYGIAGLHDIKPSLIKSDTKPEDYLSDYIINKYKNTLDFFWA